MMPTNSQYRSKPDNDTVVVAASGQTSSAFNVYGATAAVVEMPATITSTTMTFTGSIDGATGTFAQIRDKTNTAITYTISASGSYPLDPALFYGYDKIKIVMGSVEAAERTIKVKAIGI